MKIHLRKFEQNVFPDRQTKECVNAFDRLLTYNIIVIVNQTCNQIIIHIRLIILTKTRHPNEVDTYILIRRILSYRKNLISMGISRNKPVMETYFCSKMWAIVRQI